MNVDWSAGDLRPRSVSGGVASLLEQQIRSGELAQGDKLPPERELAARLGVSRTSVRQAMQELTLKGLTDRKPGRGTVVVSRESPLEVSLLSAISSQDRSLRQVTDLRQAIETTVAERAAVRATKSDLANLGASLDQAHEDLTPDESMRLDEDFHRLVARATQNPLLVTLIDATSAWLGDIRRQSHVTAEGRRASLDGHRRILKAIVEGDAGAARTAMTEHVAEVSRVIHDEQRGADRGAK